MRLTGRYSTPRTDDLDFSGRGRSNRPERVPLPSPPLCRHNHRANDPTNGTRIWEPPPMQLTYESIAKRIDHSLLGPTLTDAELEDGCRLAAAYGVASVCIKPYAVGARRRDPRRDRAWRSARRSASPTAATPRPSRSSSPSGRWTTARPSWTWSSTSARCSADDWDAVARRHRGRHRGGPRRRRDREGDLRELLPQPRADRPALPDLRRGRGRLRQDLDRLRHRRRRRAKT